MLCMGNCHINKTTMDLYQTNNIKYYTSIILLWFLIITK